MTTPWTLIQPNKTCPFALKTLIKQDHAKHLQMWPHVWEAIYASRHEKCIQEGRQDKDNTQLTRLHCDCREMATKVMKYVNNERVSLVREQCSQRHKHHVPPVIGCSLYIRGEDSREHIRLARGHNPSKYISSRMHGANNVLKWILPTSMDVRLGSSGTILSGL